MWERRRTAWRWATLVAAVALGALGGAALWAQNDPGGQALERLTLDDGLITWDGIRLGMTIPQIERRVGATVAMQKSKEPGCPTWIAEAQHRGLSLVFGFSTPKPSGKAEWIHVRFEGDLVMASGAELVAALKQKFPGAQWLPPKEPAGIAESEDLEPDFSIPGKEPQVVRLYPREALVLAKSACLG
jgi:hypothetical protein